MKSSHHIMKTICLLLLIQLVSARTVLHRRTIIDSTTLRFGGKNISADELLEQARYSKDIDLLAVRQLLSTGHPVTRTNIENGRKVTSTYSLEADGSIVCRKVEEIDMADVDRRFEEIVKQR